MDPHLDKTAQDTSQFRALVDDIAETPLNEQLPSKADVNIGLDDMDNSNALAATVESPPKDPSGPQPVSAQLKDPEVKDFGWNVSPSKVPAPVMNGISNDDLYMLLRRFNKVRFFECANMMHTE